MRRMYHESMGGPGGGPCGPPPFGHGHEGPCGQGQHAERHRHGGHHGWFGPGHGPHGGRTRRGDVRAAVLNVLAEEPMHGYQIMQRLEERSGGFWRPSPGSVYPTLQLLEDQGLVKSEEVEGRRVYSLTDAGREEADKIKQQWPTPPWERGEGPADPRFTLKRAVFEVGGAARQVGMTGSEKQVAAALEILNEARRKLYSLLADGD